MFFLIRRFARRRQVESELIQHLSGEVRSEKLDQEHQQILNQLIRFSATATATATDSVLSPGDSLAVESAKLNRRKASYFQAAPKLKTGLKLNLLPRLSLILSRIVRRLAAFSQLQTFSTISISSLLFLTAFVLRLRAAHLSPKFDVNRTR